MKLKIDNKTFAQKTEKKQRLNLKLGLKITTLFIKSKSHDKFDEEKI